MIYLLHELVREEYNTLTERKAYILRNNI